MMEQEQIMRDLTSTTILCKRCGQIGHYPNYCLDPQISPEEYDKRLQHLRAEQNKMKMIMNAKYYH